MISHRVPFGTRIENFINAFFINPSSAHLAGAKKWFMEETLTKLLNNSSCSKRLEDHNTVPKEQYDQMFKDL